MQAGPPMSLFSEPCRLSWVKLGSPSDQTMQWRISMLRGGLSALVGHSFKLRFLALPLVIPVLACSVFLNRTMCFRTAGAMVLDERLQVEAPESFISLARGYAAGRVGERWKGSTREPMGASSQRSRQWEILVSHVLRLVTCMGRQCGAGFFG